MNLIRIQNINTVKKKGFEYPGPFITLRYSRKCKMVNSLFVEETCGVNGHSGVNVF